MRIYIKKNTDYYYPILYVFKIIEKNRNLEFEYVKNSSDADIFFDYDKKNSENFSINFFKHIKSNSNALSHENIFPHSLMIYDEKGNEDIISTIFYLVNCLQELSASEKDLDKFGRFKFSKSYQYKYKNVKENFVEKLINRFCEKYSINGSKNKSRFFISHDIDKIYGSMLQDSYWALKQINFKALMIIMMCEVSKKPHWKNIDKILSINGMHDIRSTFFWLVNYGYGKDGVENADYKINEEEPLLDAVIKHNGFNGLHKSSSDMELDQEFEKGGFNSPICRYHYLKFSCKNDWDSISNSSIALDSSLGFAEHYGFRNSYGKSYQPFDIKQNKPYDFIETPLNFMDTTFDKYMKIPVNKIADIVIKFYEENPKNCDISLLWHNTYFTDFKYNSFIDEYKKIIGFIYENKIECVDAIDLINENKLIWP